VLRRELSKPEALKPRRDEVVIHDDITWIDMETWVVFHVSVGFKPMED
jgi:hypothetical protein